VTGPDSHGAMLCETEHLGHCITCGDEAVPLSVLSVDSERGLALCEDESGERTTIETALVEPVAPGDRLLAHAGTAIAEAPGGGPPA
jgi:hydrogenase expression/formation protein HypC